MMAPLFKTVGVLIEVVFGSCKRGRLLVAEWARQSRRRGPLVFREMSDLVRSTM